jgi:hypothetical protein
MQEGSTKMEWIVSICATALWFFPPSPEGWPTNVCICNGQCNSEMFSYICKTPLFHVLKRVVTVILPEEEVSWKAFLLQGFSMQLQNKQTFCGIL